MKKIIIGVVILLILIAITVIVIKERKRKKADAKDTEELKGKILSAVSESAPKVTETINKGKDLPVNKIAHVNERKPAIGTRLLVSSKVSVAYRNPEAKKGNILRAVRKDQFAGTFLSIEENNFTKLLDDRENIIFMLSKDLYYSYK